ncbi:C4-dicarboxylate ABC transporter permease [Rhodovulum sp. BSW8]|uniref:TRAP transporter small permease subunit n=1 Tax=Rhodovulum sp. BSW8 TaxID=2259645 RepID=UPI000DE42ADE|nr:TRAP transporter small permease subunit [Rhodovulum sp. BSW8]RBO54444.1 C4-dicarboxylate ABC transporter permease [Rhodovulum sp. BSW8]
MLDGILWVCKNILLAFYNFGYAVSHPGLWLDWSDKQAIMRVVYYGGSVEFFFVVFTAFLVLTAVGIWRRQVMWGAVRLLEGLANGIGRAVAWFGLLMVLQQIMIVFLQRIFRVSEIGVGPFGYTFTKDLSWWSEELKLYNAAIVALCATYTFVQSGHVRVDLVYSAVGFRAKRAIDMAGSLLFMMPVAVLVWMYSWFFMWRHLITPKPSASDTIERLLMKARAVRWNVETIGFSPNGFNGYFLFKVLLVAFTGLVFLQAIAFFYRSFLEFVEGEESAGKYLDRDSLGAGEEAYEGTH